MKQKNVAALVKELLTKKFRHKFSVTSSRSWYPHIYINYVDGPTTKQVYEAIDRYISTSGTDVDDSPIYKPKENIENVTVESASVSRSYSEEAWITAAQEMILNSKLSDINNWDWFFPEGTTTQDIANAIQFIPRKGFKPELVYKGDDIIYQVRRFLDTVDFS